MTEGEDLSDELSTPLIISSSIPIKDDVEEEVADSAISEIVDKTAYLQPPRDIYAEYPEPALQPLMPNTVRAEDPDSIANGFDDKISQVETCQEELLNGMAEAVPILNEKRKVHWVDNYGKDIAQVKEFEPRSLEQSWLDQCYIDVSDTVSGVCCHACDSGGSDEEDGESSQSCNCTIL